MKEFAYLITNHNASKIIVKSKWDNKFKILRIEVKLKDLEMTE